MDLNHARLPIPPYLHIILLHFCDFVIVSQKNRFVNGRNAKILDFIFKIPPRRLYALQGGQIILIRRLIC